MARRRATPPTVPPAIAATFTRAGAVTPPTGKTKDALDEEEEDEDTEDEVVEAVVDVLEEVEVERQDVSPPP